MLARILLLGALVAGIFVQPAAGQGKETVAWDRIGGWHIGVDRTMDDSCFAQKTYQDGTSLRVGVDGKRQTVYFVIFNGAWDLIEAGKVYPVFVVFQDRKSHELSLGAFSLGNKTALGNGGVSADFIRDFREGTSLRVVHRGLSIVHLQLRDANAAIERIADCQEAVQAAGEASAAVAPPPGKKEFSF